MENRETIADFCDQHGRSMPVGQFHVYRQEEFGCDNTPLLQTMFDRFFPGIDGGVEAAKAPFRKHVPVRRKQRSWCCG